MPWWMKSYEANNEVDDLNIIILMPGVFKYKLTSQFGISDIDTEVRLYHIVIGLYHASQESVSARARNSSRTRERSLGHVVVVLREQDYCPRSLAL